MQFTQNCQVSNIKLTKNISFHMRPTTWMRRYHRASIARAALLPDKCALGGEDGRISLVDGEDVFDGRLERVSGLLTDFERRGSVQTRQLAPRGVIAERV